MLRMTGRYADGQISYLTTPEFARQHIRPHLAAGAQKAGRNVCDVEVTALVLCSVSNDRDEAMRRARINVGTYTSAPFASPIVDFMGLQEEREWLYARLLAGGFEALPTAAPDALVKTFAIVGTPEEVIEQVAAYRGAVNHLVLHTPYVPPIDSAASEDAFRAIVAAFSREKVSR
jgi:alkanesulfonate monooxygenase SsuD/methylene tetrahydromethanopterin reductase-like flavin-dependent oxidoreductase (luciferase family)